MNSDSINKWLTLAANVGVITGIIFLALEINQSNEIAMREVRDQLSSDYLSFQISALENQNIANILMKLENRESKLTEIEETQAEFFAGYLMAMAARITLNEESGFLDEDISRRLTNPLIATIRDHLAIIPYLRREIGRDIYPPKGVSPVFDAIYNEIE